MPDSEGQTKRRKLNTQDEEISQNSAKDDWISGRSDAGLNDDEAASTRKPEGASNPLEDIIEPTHSDSAEPQSVAEPSRVWIDDVIGRSSIMRASEQASGRYASKPATNIVTDVFADRQLREKNHRNLMNRKWLPEEQHNIEQAALYKQAAMQIDSLTASPEVMSAKAFYEEQSRKLSRELMAQTVGTMSPEAEEKEPAESGSRNADVKEGQDKARNNLE